MATAYPDPDIEPDQNHNNKAYEPGEEELGQEDGLTAEFKHQIGLVDEEGDLSEAFKARIGLGGSEGFNEVAELELSIAEERDTTLSQFNFVKYAKENFQQGVTSYHTTEHLTHPLLPKTQEVDKLASLAVWLAVLRFMKDLPIPEGTENRKSRTPVMTKLYRTLEAHNSKRRKSSTVSNEDVPKEEKASFKLEKQKSWKNIFSRSNSKDKKEDEKLARRNSTKSTASVDLEYSADTTGMLAAIPTTDMDLVHFIIGHGILRKDLRDEIFCQICKQMSKNPGEESLSRGWMLVSLCAGCIVPSEGFMKTLRCFLRDCSEEHRPYSRYCRRILRRTLANGPRYHPPNWLEYLATKLRKYVVLPVTCSDRRIESVEADSATTALDICTSIASKLKLKDTFGFSIYICIYDKVSSLGSGMDHVMDAISECEQVVIYKGRKQEDAPWRLYFRKEIFTPWHDPGLDPIATGLIYSQIIGGVRSEEYKFKKEESLAALVARRWYIEHGAEIVPGKLQQELGRYMPNRAVEERSRDIWTNLIIAAFEKHGLANKPSIKQVKEDVVNMAVSRWPLQFSGLFEAFKISGPKLNKNDIVLAISSQGLFFLDEPYKIAKFYKYYEIVDLYSSRSTKNRGQSVSMVTVAGEEYTFISPNADTVSTLVKDFLAGLRRRSRWGIGLDNFQMAATDGGAEPFSFKQGDIVELLNDVDSTAQREDWCNGRNLRTGTEGTFPFDIIYVLPTMTKPPDNFLSLFQMMSQENVQTLPRKRKGVVLAKGTIGRHAMHGKDSAA